MPLSPQRQPVPFPASQSRVVLGGADVDLQYPADVMACVRRALAIGDGKTTRSSEFAPLAIASANLDHIHHFGIGGASARDLDTRGSSPSWLVLLDGMPLIRRVRAMTGIEWPLLAGSDLLPWLLDTAGQQRVAVGFLGGTTQMHQRLLKTLTAQYPSLRVSGLWSPQRAELSDPASNAALAGAIRASGTDLLVVGLGKPRQERWIQQYAEASGARVLLAFGAAADFLAGTATRAPSWVRQHDLEWLYRLVKEPRRLGRRYCLQAPVALWKLWTKSRAA